MGQQSLLVTSAVVSGSASGNAHPKLHPLTADSRPDVEGGRQACTHARTHTYPQNDMTVQQREISMNGISDIKNSN